MKLTSDSIDRFLSSMYENGRSENSVRAYRSDLTGLLKYMIQTDNVEESTTERTAALYLTRMREKTAPRTIQRKLAAFRAFARYHGEATFLATYKPPTPPKPQPHPLPEGIDGVLAMYGYASEPHHKAIVVLCGLMGLRISEARQVRVCDFDLVEQSVLVRGKGSKQRWVPMGAKAWALLHGPYLVAQDQRGVTGLLVPISDRGARAAYTRIAKRALNRKSSTHDMRATAATAWYDKTKDIRAVQENLGHASSHTTETYTGVTVAAQRKAVEV